MRSGGRLYRSLKGSGFPRSSPWSRLPPKLRIFLVYGFLLIGGYLAIKYYLTSPLIIISRIIKFGPYHHPFSTEIENISYILNTTGCQIYDMESMNADVRRFFLDSAAEATRNCRSKAAPVTLVNNTYFKINPKYRNESKYSICCYKEITRINEDPGNYSLDADNRYNFSKHCIQIKEGMELNVSFAKISCKHRFDNERDYIARVLPPDLHSPETREKLEYWDVIPYRPPNLLILGIDSLSRLHFTRSMPKTRKFLLRNDFIEFLGLTRIGESTLPNIYGTLMGMTEPQVLRICWKNNSHKVDECPFIWKEFSLRNYITAFVEDAPGISTFNYHKTGFVQQPTDYFPRPLMLAHHESLNTGNGGTNSECINGGTPTDFLQKYIKNFLKVVGNYPFFLHSWFTTVGHDDFTGPKVADVDFLHFFEDIVSSVGNNTVILLLSDHGYRYGDFRETINGFFEASLPAFALRIPPSLKNFRFDWYENLKVNAHRLIAPLDIYETFQDVLHLSDRDSIYWRSKRNHSWTNRVHPYSLFDSIPENRTCEDAQIPREYCMCSLVPKVIDLSLQRMKSMFQDFGNVAVEKMNLILEPHKKVCSILSLKSVDYAMQTTRTTDYNDFVFKFSTFIWAKFEAKVRAFVGNSTFEIVGEISRISSYKGQSDCILDPKIKLFCMCKDVQPFYTFLLGILNS